MFALYCVHATGQTQANKTKGIDDRGYLLALFITHAELAMMPPSLLRGPFFGDKTQNAPLDISGPTVWPDIATQRFSSFTSAQVSRLSLAGFADGFTVLCPGASASPTHNTS